LAVEFDFADERRREGDVVSLLFYLVVVYSTFRVQMVKQCFAHIFQARICLNPSHSSAADDRSMFIRRATSAPEILSSRTAK
jgi:hypothetical protein